MVDMEDTIPTSSTTTRNKRQVLIEAEEKTPNGKRSDVERSGFIFGFNTLLLLVLVRLLTSLVVVSTKNVDCPIIDMKTIVDVLDVDLAKTIVLFLRFHFCN